MQKRKWNSSSVLAASLRLLSVHVQPPDILGKMVSRVDGCKQFSKVIEDGRITG